MDNSLAWLQIMHFEGNQTKKNHQSLMIQVNHLLIITLIIKKIILIFLIDSNIQLPLVELMCVEDTLDIID